MHTKINRQVMDPKDLIVGISQLYYKDELMTVSDQTFSIMNRQQDEEKVFNYKPISLSVDILEKIADKTSEFSFSIETLRPDIYFNIVLSNDDYFYPSISQSYDFAIDDTISLDPIQYFHELQKIIFVLFKKEIKL